MHGSRVPAAAPSEGTWQSPIGVALATTALVTVLSYGVPSEHTATAVGLAFLGITYWVALRSDDPDAARRFGLSLGGLFDPEPLDAGRVLKSAAVELGVALLVALVVFPPFWLGYRLWWSPAQPFRPAPIGSILDEALGQFLVIAIPEEAFYRGYLETRLDEAWKPRWSVLGVALGPGVVVTSAIFALGHVATELSPNRLSVFFPSLLFGWLRTKRRGIGSAAAFHALCNLFASYLAKSYGF
jgi:membrane protease YdiL (CAAX protease family)